MKSLIILGAREYTRPAFTPGQGQSPSDLFALFDAAAPAHPAETVLLWRLAVEGFGRNGLGDGPWTVQPMEFETPRNATRDDLRAAVARASAEDVSNYRAGD
jgi:hypothetical protein